MKKTKSSKAIPHWTKPVLFPKWVTPKSNEWSSFVPNLQFWDTPDFVTNLGLSHLCSKSFRWPIVFFFLHYFLPDSILNFINLATTSPKEFLLVWSRTFLPDENQVNIPINIDPIYTLYRSYIYIYIHTYTDPIKQKKTTDLVAPIPTPPSVRAMLELRRPSCWLRPGRMQYLGGAETLCGEGTLGTFGSYGMESWWCCCCCCSSSTTCWSDEKSQPCCLNRLKRTMVFARVPNACVWCCCQKLVGREWVGCTSRATHWEHGWLACGEQWSQCKSLGSSVQTQQLVILGHYPFWSGYRWALPRRGWVQPT